MKFDSDSSVVLIYLKLSLALLLSVMTKETFRFITTIKRKKRYMRKTAWDEKNPIALKDGKRWGSDWVEMAFSQPFFSRVKPTANVGSSTPYPWLG